MLESFALGCRGFIHSLADGVCYDHRALIPTRPQHVLEEIPTEYRPPQMKPTSNFFVMRHEWKPLTEEPAFQTPSVGRIKLKVRGPTFPGLLFAVDSSTSL